MINLYTYYELSAVFVKLTAMVGVYRDSYTMYARIREETQKNKFHRRIILCSAVIKADFYHSRHVRAWIWASRWNYWSRTVVV